ncbi:TspO/MBR family protein [Pseudobacillus wudalianchiensis]|uniref:TspO protein n=1 Tax=Pseudobacillus wudalianchiensis TaxID=1743143 RepID=A0A1B9AYC2_9BACI|nr:TspO/MBR family protein [Bacillus wudalianchiensis]OCA88869.1 TspO protein [Bacillus wudalianchiensis]
MELLKVNGKINAGKLTANVLLPVVGGSLVGYFATRNAKKEYKRLEKPDFSPPSWVFPTVWTGLYTAMGIARYRAAAKTEKKERLLPYDIQLGLNFLWSFLFFKWNLRGAAFVEIALLLGMITLTAYEFYQLDRTAGNLMIPYAAWVTFALGLNYSIWKMN